MPAETPVTVILSRSDWQLVLLALHVATAPALSMVDLERIAKLISQAGIDQQRG